MGLLSINFLLFSLMRCEKDHCIRVVSMAGRQHLAQRLEIDVVMCLHVDGCYFSGELRFQKLSVDVPNR